MVYKLERHAPQHIFDSKTQYNKRHWISSYSSLSFIISLRLGGKFESLLLRRIRTKTVCLRGLYSEGLLKASPSGPNGARPRPSSFQPKQSKHSRLKPSTLRSRCFYEVPFVWLARGGRRRGLFSGDNHNEGAGQRMELWRLYLLLHGVRVEHGGHRASATSAAAAAVAVLCRSAVANHAADEVDWHGEDDGGVFLGGDGTQSLKGFVR